MLVRVLGPLEVVEAGRPLRIGGPREHVVLATLALRANRVVSVDQLMDAVWGDLSPSTARGQVQGCISVLRKLFADAGRPEAITTRPSGYLLTVPDEELDSLMFARLVASASAEASESPADAAATLRTALELWRGPALDGLFSEVVSRGAALLDGSRVAAVEERARLELELGRHAEIAGELEALLAEHPLRERLCGFLMLALYRSGRQAEALDVFRHARTTLVAELGIEPCRELRDLEHAVLNRDPALDLPGAAEVTDVPADSPPRPRQLPTSIGDFIGRAETIAEVRRVLTGTERGVPSRYAVPIVSLSGRGGVGKSTLALRVAHELADDFPDGHLYVDLQGPAGENRPGAVLGRFLRALGVSGSALPEGEAERGELYRSRLDGKRLLLVLDDVSCEQQVLPLLPGSSTCAVLVTSRSRLAGLSGAHRIDLDAFDSETSRALLAEIVGPDRVAAERSAVDELVRYCGGLPLALRIAGARLAARPQWRIAELSRRLADEVRRLDELSHHGLELRSSIGLTYRGLPEGAQRLFRLLSSVYAFDLPAWSAAALLDIDAVEAERLLEVLVDAQLLYPIQDPAGRLRYRFHDLVRVYARERLTESEPEGERREAVGRLLGSWLALAEQVHRREFGGDFAILHGRAARHSVSGWTMDDALQDPMGWLDGERASLVAAVRQAAAAGLDELCWDLALTSVSLFEAKGYMDDWRETTEVAYLACLEAGNRRGCAAILYSLGTLHMIQKRPPEAKRAFAEALELFEAVSDVHGQALVLRNAALVDGLLNDFERMWSRYVDALAKMRAVGDPIGESNVLRGMAKFRIDEGDVEEARTLLARALELCEQAGYLRGQAQVQSRFADLHLRTGHTLLARQALQQVLRTVRAMGDPVGEAHALYGLGVVRSREGRLDSAAATLRLAVLTAQRVGEGLIEGQSEYALGEIAVTRDETTVAVPHLRRARTLFAHLGASIWEAKTLVLLSEADAGGPTDVHLDEARALLRQIGSKEATRLLRQLSAPGPAADDVTAGVSGRLRGRG